MKPSIESVLATDQRLALGLPQRQDHFLDEEHWESNAKEALRKARARHKLVFVAATHGDYFSGRL